MIQRVGISLLMTKLKNQPNCSLQIGTMQIILYHDAVRLLNCKWLWYGCYHFRSVKSFVISARAKRVLDPIERLPNEWPDWSWCHRWGSLEWGWSGAGWVNCNDNCAGVSNGVANIFVQNFPWRYLPVCSCQPYMNTLILRPLWSRMTMVMMIDSNRMRQSWAIIKNWSFQNEVVTLLVWKRYELII